MDRGRINWSNVGDLTEVNKRLVGILNFLGE